MNQGHLLELLSRFPSANVLILGDLMLDRFVYGSVERISPEAPIPVMSIGKSVDVPGGAANVARNVASMGAQAILLGVVGSDATADILIRLLTNERSMELHLIVDPSRPTTAKTRYVADRQQVLRVDSESRAALLPDVAEALLAAYRGALEKSDVVVLSDYAKGVLSYETTREAIAIAKSAGKIIIIDPKSQDFSKYAGSTVLTPNRHELQLAVRHECVTDQQVTAGARSLLDMGVCETMIVTRGKDGMTVVERAGRVAHLHTTAREVFDVSGAGDTALAALSIGLAGGVDVTDAAKIANAAAGIVVGKLGTASVSLSEIVSSIETSGRPGSNEKIFTFEAVSNLVAGWRESGCKIAFANGCFDILHPGHVSLLDQARKSADKLVVGLNSDTSVRRLKGLGRPVNSEIARATVLSSLKSVDAVVIFSDDTPLEMIDKLSPDVLVKGADYTIETVVGADLVIARGGRVVLAELLPGHSTTNTIQRANSSDEP